MLRRFQIKNFRCFEELSIDLADVNLVIGKNNVGKSSLLEALFLHAGPTNPGLAINLNAHRGLNKLGTSAGETWGWLFRNHDTAKSIELLGTNDKGEEHKLTVRHTEPTDTSGIAKNDLNSVGQETTEKPVYPALNLVYADTDGAEMCSAAYLDNEGLKLQSEHPSPFPASSLHTIRMAGPEHDARRFSELEGEARHQPIVEALRVLEPRLERLVVSYSGSGVVLLKGDIGTGRLVPLPMMGEGMTRLASTVLRVASSPGGMVLIDEIETGIRHDILPSVWEAIDQIAQDQNCQIVATTHSHECIVAAHQAFSQEGRSSFALHRLQMIDGEVSVVTYDEETLATSLEMHMEVR